MEERKHERCNCVTAGFPSLFRGPRKDTRCWSPLSAYIVCCPVPFRTSDWKYFGHCNGHVRTGRGPGAKVTVTAPTIGLTRNSTTNESGAFLIPLLGVATYNVLVEQKGFQNATAQEIRLQVDEHRELDFKLAAATVQTTVEVSATQVAVQTSDATLGQVITSQQVADLPLNGRDFVQLATLMPGVSQETNPNSSLQKLSQ